MESTDLDGCKTAFRKEICQWKNKYTDLEEEVKELRMLLTENKKDEVIPSSPNDEIGRALARIEKECVMLLKKAYQK